MPPPDATYSIVVRVRRVTTEDAYVRVPVTDAVMAADLDADGHRHLDGGKVMAEARRLAGSGTAAWQVQEQEIDLHPVQDTPPDGR
ncbi:hypothetical protein ACFO1B_34355 [Dactylosporangium siamense]|uniref:Uncharacterized protein n=1 Tax=Dactylosporangium siamense TaxID=685454 RepID=A0A919U6T4_9ACTN|nr:hypothetical protein [Dactylosporangium siamense]GIG44799.1 hypothetical protein Dsi01nite_028400 [Dactylosporangium siamense]